MKILLIARTSDRDRIAGLLAGTRYRNAALCCRAGLRAGRQLLRKEPDSVCLLADPLPDGGSFPLLQEALMGRPDAAVILIQGSGAEVPEESALEMGAADVLPLETLTPPLLERSIRYALERQRRRLLQESEARFRTICEASPIGIFLTDAAGKALYANAAARRQTALLPGEGGELAWTDAIHPDDRERVRTEWRRALHSGTRFESCFRLLRRDGQTLWIDIKALPLRGGERLLGYVGTSENVTERVRLEAQLRQSQKMEAVGRLAGGVAHDFNNMLAVINGYSELVLQRLPQDEPARGYVEEIRKAGERAAGLTRQLLAFSRKQILEPRILDLNEVLRNTDKMLRRLIGENIELVTVFDPALDRIRADAGQIEQVVVNLAVNARDAMPDGGKLILSTENVYVSAEQALRRPEIAPGRYVLLTVTDTGVGMTREVLAHIFEPFFTTKEKGKGTGLGLATVYGIVKQSGGYIYADSRPGQGSTFRVYFPRVESDEPAREQPRRPVLPVGTETILVAEDEPIVRRLVREVLTTCGYRVLEAINGDEALRLCREHPGPIPLLVADVIMPGMGGRELAERARDVRPEMRVLFMSGYTNDEGVSRGVQEAAVAFLQKPFTPEALARRVREVLDGRPDPALRGRVLLVDDDPRGRESLEELLEAEGFRVEAVANGREALQRLEEGSRPDVILLDLVMPSMNGWVFRIEQKKQRSWAEIPVVLFSGSEDPAAAAAYLDAVAHFRKPIDVAALVETLKRICS